jgi:hypothetical protein
MPTPAQIAAAKRRKNYQAAKEDNDVPTLASTYLGDIANAEGWYNVIMTICKALKLPGTHSNVNPLYQTQNLIFGIC